MEVRKNKVIDVLFLQVDARVRYWEDATVNGVVDENGDLIPCKFGDYWQPLINIKTGVILNWEKGKRADVYYKVCDEGQYWLNNSDGKKIAKARGCYVPKYLCPKTNGYGDYIIMDIDENGKIDGWEFDTYYDSFYKYWRDNELNDNEG